jgi:HK97 family phage prohead protease
VEIIDKKFFVGAEIKDMDEKQGIVTGYFSSFNTLDSDNDIILHGAFTKSIAENGPQSPKPRIRHLLNHDLTQPLGDIQVLKEDSKGLYYESKVGTHALGVDFMKMVSSNLIKEHSIGFQIMKWDKGNKEMDCRYLKELKLWEGSSLTAFGANENTPLTGVKSLDAYIERQNDLTKAIANGTFTDETIKLLCSELERINKFLQEAFKSYGTTQPEFTTTTEPNDEKELLIELQSINKLFKSFDNNGNKRSIG